MRILRTGVFFLPQTALLKLIYPWQIEVYGTGSLWYGALATAAATFVGHYPVRLLSSVPFHRPDAERNMSVVWDLHLFGRRKFLPFCYAPYFGTLFQRLLGLLWSGSDDVFRIWNQESVNGSHAGTAIYISGIG
jgi:hypothetical protein